MKPIIKIENLSKQYAIGGKQEGYTTFRESLINAAKVPLNVIRGRRRSNNESFWALKDINFEITPGEVVGIIGRNGAGKSTLLKILSRITEPTTGKIELYGRVGSLLEVGTGFHPELTGRENIYLNGSILGMKREEITKKFDEIVDFAEIENFLDTPVKRYSSGMYTRLAFAVAANLEPEILVVDEVLSVGDAEFQKKCLGKMEDVGKQGRTVFFVSHNMPMILRLCNRVILLGQGELIADGNPNEVAGIYLSSSSGSPAQREWNDLNQAPGNEAVKLKAVKIVDDSGIVSETIDISKPFSVQIEYVNLQNFEASNRPTVSMHFVNEEGTILFCSTDFVNKEWWETPRREGVVKAECHIPPNLFAEGRIFLLVGLCNYNPNFVYFIERDIVSFQVVDKTEGEGVRGVYAGHYPGVMRPMLDWEINQKKRENAAQLTANQVDLQKVK